MKASSKVAMKMRVHHELSVPSKLISVWIRPSTKTPTTVPAR